MRGYDEAMLAVKSVSAAAHRLYVRDDDGRFAVTGGAPHEHDDYAPAAVFAEAQRKAQAKAENVPKPSEATLAKYAAVAERIKKGEVRAGGEFRGNSKDRKRSRDNLFKEFGGLEVGYVPCVHCGMKLGAQPPPPPEVIVRDKILVFSDGGGYQLANLVPSCHKCNSDRSDAPFALGQPKWRTEVKALPADGTTVRGRVFRVSQDVLDRNPDIDDPDIPANLWVTGPLRRRWVESLGYLKVSVGGVTVDPETVEVAGK